ncbi:hypothetical protein KM043_015053 [Ampulex compressa]|nr:hypothetical protein KM043_015053 [Ampulex compressa]
MNSTITIEDTDEEVIDLDKSQDAITDAYDNEKGDRCVNAEKSSSSNIVDDNDDVDEPKTSSKPRSSDLEILDGGETLQPLIKVMFRDESVSRRYKKQVRDYLEKLVLSESKECTEDDNDSSLIVEIWESNVDSIDPHIQISTESEDSQDVMCTSLFEVDTQPKLYTNMDIPTYGKKYENAFEKSNTESDKGEQNPYVSKSSCFNCLGDHNLRDCPEPRNQNHINKNRKNFNRERGESKSLRYHLDNDQKFGHITPGQMSKNLRKALGLKDNELPKHIYRMRTLGYPPGWLEEARLQHSGLSLFNSDGKAENDVADEVGEIIDEGDKDRYDIKKIYDFPGFNVPSPIGTNDPYKQYWEPHMQAHSKDTMLLMLSGKKTEAYKRKKLKLSNAISTCNSEAISSEMEIECANDGIVQYVPVNGLFIPPLPKESPIKVPEPPPPPPPPPQVPIVSEDSSQSQELPFPDSADDSTSPSSRANSPSLSDLECMKTQLLVELEDSSSQSNPDTPLKSSSVNSSIKSEMPPPSTDVTPETNRCRSVLNTSHGSVKSVDLGTPILQSTSPYSKLPPSDKFSKNICDVINFENLPDATGKYEQMTEILQKVRNTLAKLQ